MRAVLGGGAAAIVMSCGSVLAVSAGTIQPSLYPALPDGSASDPMNTGSAVCVGATWTSEPLGLIVSGSDLSGIADVELVPGENVTAEVLGAWGDPGIGHVEIVEDHPVVTFTMPGTWPRDGGPNSIYGHVLTPAFFRIRLDAVAVESVGAFGAEIRFSGDMGSAAVVRVMGIGSGINVETPVTARANGHPEICPADRPTDGPEPTVPQTSTVGPTRQPDADGGPGAGLATLLACAAIVLSLTLARNRRR